MKKYKLLICDFDYTLADATGGIASSINYALEVLGYNKVSEEEIRKTVGYMLEDVLTMLTGCSDPKMQDEFVVLFRRHADIVMTENTNILPHTEYFMKKAVDAGIKLAILSSKENERINEAFEKWGLGGIFDLVLGCLEVENPKPHEEGLLKAIAHFNMDKNDCIYIGDTVIDAECARNAGIDFAGVTTGTTDAQTLESFPNVGVFENLGQLADKLI